MFSWFKKPDPESDEALVAEIKQKFKDVQSLAKKARERGISCELKYNDGYATKMPYIDYLQWDNAYKSCPGKRFD